MKFQNREEAGALLSEALQHYKDKAGVVYALPRGGVVLGAQVAAGLDMPLDLLIPRKVGAPFNPEYAICAVTEGGNILCDPLAVSEVREDWLQEEIEKQQAEAARRRKLYLSGRQRADVRGKTAIVIDDGIATGLTMLAALAELKTKMPERIVVAIPVIPPDTAKVLSQYMHELIAIEMPYDYLGSVGAYYHRFDQVEDEEVIRLLKDGACYGKQISN